MWQNDFEYLAPMLICTVFCKCLFKLCMDGYFDNKECTIFCLNMQIKDFNSKLLSSLDFPLVVKSRVTYTE